MASDEIGDCEPQCETTGPSLTGRRRLVVSLDRRRELLRLADEAAQWIADKGIKPYELCVFRGFVDNLVDTR